MVAFVRGLTAGLNWPHHTMRNQNGYSKMTQKTTPDKTPEAPSAKKTEKPTPRRGRRIGLWLSLLMLIAAVAIVYFLYLPAGTKLLVDRTLGLERTTPNTSQQTPATKDQQEALKSRIVVLEQQLARVEDRLTDVQIASQGRQESRQDFTQRLSALQQNLRSQQAGLAGLNALNPEELSEVARFIANYQAQRTNLDRTIESLSRLKGRAAQGLPFGPELTDFMEASAAFPAVRLAANSLEPFAGEPPAPAPALLMLFNEASQNLDAAPTTEATDSSEESLFEGLIRRLRGTLTRLIEIRRIDQERLTPVVTALERGDLTAALAASQALVPVTALENDLEAPLDDWQRQTRRRIALDNAIENVDRTLLSLLSLTGILEQNPTLPSQTTQ